MMDRSLARRSVLSQSRGDSYAVQILIPAFADRSCAEAEHWSAVTLQYFRCCHLNADCEAD
jgi:hypothetical protein